MPTIRLSGSNAQIRVDRMTQNQNPDAALRETAHITTTKKTPAVNCPARFRNARAVYVENEISCRSQYDALSDGVMTIQYKADGERNERAWGLLSLEESLKRCLFSCGGFGTNSPKFGFP